MRLGNLVLFEAVVVQKFAGRLFLYSPCTLVCARCSDVSYQRTSVMPRTPCFTAAPRLVTQHHTGSLLMPSVLSSLSPYDVC